MGLKLQLLHLPHKLLAAQELGNAKLLGSLPVGLLPRWPGRLLRMRLGVLPVVDTFSLGRL